MKVYIKEGEVFLTFEQIIRGLDITYHKKKVGNEYLASAFTSEDKAKELMELVSAYYDTSSWSIVNENDI